MFDWLFGSRQRKRDRLPGADRAERNAVIRRIVTAAANSSKKGAQTPENDAGTVNPTALVPTSGPVRPTDSGRIPQDQIAERAMAIWIRNGRPVGTADRDWQQALRELEAELADRPRPS